MRRIKTLALGVSVGFSAIVHGPANAGAIIARSRARANREIIVPIGMLVVAAISLYEKALRVREE